MKKLFVSIAALFIMIVASAQTPSTYAGIGAGYSTGKSGVTDLHFGYDFNTAFIQAGFITNLSNKADKGVILNIRAGHTFDLDYIGIQPSVGYGYNYVSSDNSTLNKSAFIGSLYVTHDIVYFGQLFAGANYSQKTTYFSLGIRLIYYKAEKYGCNYNL